MSKLLFIIRATAHACLDSDIIGIKAEQPKFTSRKAVAAGLVQNEDKKFPRPSCCIALFLFRIVAGLDRKNAAGAIESDIRGIKEDRHANS